MALRKAFPQERKYDFWNILMCYLINKDASLPEKDRTLFGMLAFRLVSKAAEAVPKDKVRREPWMLKWGLYLPIIDTLEGSDYKPWKSCADARRAVSSDEDLCKPRPCARSDQLAPMRDLWPRVTL